MGMFDDFKVQPERVLRCPVCGEVEPFLNTVTMHEDGSSHTYSACVNQCYIEIPAREK